MEGIEDGATASGRGGAKSPLRLDADLIESNGELYTLIRTVPSELAQGVHTSSEDLGNSRKVTTVRIDEVMAAGKIYKIDLTNKRISEPKEFENILVGQQPYMISPDGTLIFNTLNQKKKERVKLLVK